MADLAAIYKDSSPSLTKATLVGIHLLVVVIVVWLLLGSGAAVLENLFGRSLRLASNLPPARCTAAVLYFLRTLATVFVFLKRRET